MPDGGMLAPEVRPHVGSVPLRPADLAPAVVALGLVILKPLEVAPDLRLGLVRLALGGRLGGPGIPGLGHGGHRWAALVSDPVLPVVLGGHHWAALVSGPVLPDVLGGPDALGGRRFRWISALFAGARLLAAEFEAEKEEGAVFVLLGFFFLLLLLFFSEPRRGTGIFPRSDRATS